MKEPKIINKLAENNECIFIKNVPRYLEFECGHKPSRLFEIMQNVKINACDECLKKIYENMIDNMPEVDEEFRPIYCNNL